MIVLIFIFVFFILLGAATLAYQIYHLTKLDAKSRGLKHPKFWGLFSMGGNNGSGGLILYLIGRRKYLSTMSDADKQIMDSRKKKTAVSLCFIAIGTIGSMAIGLFGNI